MLGSLSWFILNVRGGANYCPRAPFGRIPSVYSGRHVGAPNTRSGHERMLHSLKGTPLGGLRWSHDVVVILVAAEMTTEGSTGRQRASVSEMRREESRSRRDSGACHSFRVPVSRFACLGVFQRTRIAPLAREVTLRRIHTGINGSTSSASAANKDTYRGERTPHIQRGERRGGRPPFLAIKISNGPYNSMTFAGAAGSSSEKP